MNIFILDDEPIMSARYHVDKHVVKMPIEYAQMLSTSHRLLDGKESVIELGKRKKVVYTLNNDLEDKLYKTTHINHPCTVWVRESKSNYEYLFNLLKLVLKEYTRRYEKVHKCSELLEYLEIPPRNIKSNGLTNHPKCMPEDCIMDSVVDSYRKFYLKYKAHILNWKHNKIPYWIQLNPSYYD